MNDASGPATPPRGGLYIPSLNGIRAIAVGIVIVSHSGLGDRVPGGLGVTIFFLLSGFLITTLLRREFARTGKIKLRDFYLRRALRILPPLYIAVALALGLFLLRPNHPPIPVPGTLSQALQVSNYFLIYNTGSQIILPGTGAFWSLAVEEHFYVIFPLLYVWMVARFRDRGQAVLQLSLCAAALVWRCVLIWHFKVDSLRTYYATDTRFDSILIGCVFAVIANPVFDDPFFRRLVAHMRWLIPISLSVLVATLMYRNDGFRETWRYSLQGLALVPLFIAAIHYPKSAPARFLNLQFVSFLGVLSYALYLFHGIFLDFVHETINVGPLSGGVIAIALTFGAAVGVHYFVEKPLARIRARHSHT
ncbi:MAG: acyltransferase [Gemmatimonadaceae bacterium]